MPGHPSLKQLAHPPLRPHFGGGRHEQLKPRAWRNHRPDVAAVEDGAAGLPREIALPLQQRRAHRRIGRNRRGDPRHGLAPQLLVRGIDAQHVGRPKRFEFARRVPAPSPQVERDGAIEQPGVHVRQAEVRGERPGDGPLPARGRSVDRDHERARRGSPPGVIRCILASQVARFDRRICLWQGAPPNAGQTPAKRIYWS